MTKLAIGIDLGCTNTKGVLINSDGMVLKEIQSETFEQDHQRWKETVKNMITSLKAGTSEKLNVVGLSAPGLADSSNRCISFMPGRLPGLENFDWSSWIGHPVWVLNDAHAALMAEASFGAAKDLQHAILLSLGTGVGGGILINGKLYQGVGQMAGHLGHTTINASTDKRDVTNMAGSIEDAIGNLSVFSRSHGRYQNTQELVAAYQKGNAIATWVWLTSLQKLSVSIASAINTLSPEAVILSGGITNAKESLLQPLREFMELYEWRPGGKKTDIRLARFSELAGAIGAAAYSLSKNDHLA